MSIRTHCPDCDAPVTAPDDTAGYAIDCPKCGADVPIPRRKRADRDETDRPKRRPVRDDRADGDDRPRARGRERDDGDDRPPKARSRGKKKRKASPALVIGLVGGGFLAFLLVLGVVGWLVFGRSSADTKEIAGEKWYKASDPDGVFSAYFPGGEPKSEKVAFRPPEFIVKKSGMSADEMAWSMQAWTRRHHGREYAVSVFTQPAGSSPEDAARTVAVSRLQISPKIKVLVDDTITVGGHQGRRQCVQAGGKGEVFVIFPMGDRKVVMVSVSGSDTFDHEESKVKAFLNNLTFHQ